jgi:hypothetical protein
MPLHLQYSSVQYSTVQCIKNILVNLSYLFNLSLDLEGLKLKNGRKLLNESWGNSVEIMHFQNRSLTPEIAWNVNCKKGIFLNEANDSWFTSFRTLFEQRVLNKCTINVGPHILYRKY